MGSWDRGSGCGVPGLSEFMGEELPILAQGYCIHLSARVYFDGHGLGTILHW